MTSKSSPSFSEVAYPPIVDNCRKRCVEMCTKAGEEHSIQTFDQQLYAIVQQVKWPNPDEFKNHILRLGGFHTLSCFIACIDSE